MTNVSLTDSQIAILIHLIPKDDDGNAKTAKQQDILNLLKSHLDI
jgi:hypothetical protein